MTRGRIGIWKGWWKAGSSWWNAAMPLSFPPTPLSPSLPWLHAQSLLLVLFRSSSALPKSEMIAHRECKRKGPAVERIGKGDRLRTANDIKSPKLGLFRRRDCCNGLRGETVVRSSKVWDGGKAQKWWACFWEAERLQAKHMRVRWVFVDVVDDDDVGCWVLQAIWSMKPCGRERRDCRCRKVGREE